MISPGRDAPRRRSVALGIVLVLGVLVVGLTAFRWWTHPLQFADHGDAFVAKPVPVADAALSMAVAVDVTVRAR